MFTKITRKAPLDFISVAEAKDQLNIIDNDDDDQHIATLVKTAQEMVEKGTNRLLSRCTVGLECDYRNTWFFLPYGEITTITSCQSDGVDVTYEFSEISQRIKLTDVLTAGSVVTITYDAGYEEVPTSLKAAGLIIVSNLYEFREDWVEASLQKSPLASRTLMSSYKLPIGEL